MKYILKKSAIIIFFLPFYLFSLRPALAKIELTDYPTSICIDKEFKIGMALSNLSDPVHYLSVALHKKSGDAYFGMTKNGDNWIEADKNNCKNFPQISVVEGSWSGKLIGRIVYNEKDYNNSFGDYILKVIKYSDSCSESSSKEVVVNLYDPNPPSITPTNPPSATPTHKPTSTPKATSVSKPSSTPKPQIKATANTPVVPINTPVVLLTSNLFDKSIQISSPGSQTDEVLGEFTSEEIMSGGEIGEATKAGSKSNYPILAILLVGGLVCFLAAAVISIRQIKNREIKN